MKEAGKNMKSKYLATTKIFFILFILFSVPSTLSAQENISQRKGDRTIDIRLDRNQLKANVLESRNVLRERTRDREVFDRTSYDAAVDRFMNARRDYLRERNNISFAKNYLMHLVDTFVDHSIIVEKRLDSLPVTDEKVKSEAKEAITDDIEELVRIKKEIEAAQNRNDLNEIANVLQEQRKESKEARARKLTILAHIDVYENKIFGVAKSRLSEMEAGLDALSSQGVDILKERGLLLQAGEIISQSAEDVAQLRVRISNTPVSESDFERAKSVLTDVKNGIRQAYGTFGNIARNIDAR